jgi:hypothetical protein
MYMSEMVLEEDIKKRKILKIKKDRIANNNNANNS